MANLSGKLRAVLVKRAPTFIVNSFLEIISQSRSKGEEGGCIFCQGKFLFPYVKPYKKVQMEALYLGGGTDLLKLSIQGHI
jgi:hypothetical protein